MMKNNKGVTLIALVITIIVMLIILGITVVTLDNLLRGTDLRKMKTNLHLIEARAQTLLNDYLFDGTDKLGAGTTKDVTEFGWEINEEQYIYRQWNASDLAKQGIKNTDVASNEFFIIQYDIINEEVDVASTRGIKDEDGNSYYTLSSLRNK